MYFDYACSVGFACLDVCPYVCYVAYAMYGCNVCNVGCVCYVRCVC